MWQRPHARASGRFPCATTSGIVGWSPGYQSAGPKPSAICWRVNVSVVPGSDFGDVSGGAGVGAAAPCGGGFGIAYAQAGGSPAARVTVIARNGTRARTRAVAILRTTSLQSERSANRGTIHLLVCDCVSGHPWLV